LSIGVKIVNTQAKDILYKAYKGSVNFMTPEIIRIGMVGDGRHAYEISSGEGFDRSTTIYGVAIVDADGCKNTDLSGCVDSMAGAEEKLESIRDLYR
jgi:hypothetical protein